MLATLPSLHRRMKIYCQPFISSAELKESVIGNYNIVYILTKVSILWPCGRHCSAIGTGPAAAGPMFSQPTMQKRLSNFCSKQWHRNHSSHSGFGRYTLYRPKKIIFITCYKLLIAQQPLHCSSLVRSYMRTFLLKVHCHYQNVAYGMALARG